MKLNSVLSSPDFCGNVHHSLSQELEQLKHENAILKSCLKMAGQLDLPLLKFNPLTPAQNILGSPLISNPVSDQVLDKIYFEQSTPTLTLDQDSQFPSFIPSSPQQQPEFLTENLYRQISALEDLIEQQIQNSDPLNGVIQQTLETAIEILDPVKQISLWLDPQTQDDFKPSQIHRKNKPQQAQEDWLCLYNLNRLPLREHQQLDCFHQIEIPIRSRTQTVGFLQIQSRTPQTEWTANQQSFLHCIANLISLALQQFKSQSLEQKLSFENHQLQTQLAQQTTQLQQNRQTLRSQTTQCQTLKRTLKKAQNTAQSARRAKRSFLANISHELRTPIHAIIGYSDLLCEEISQQGRVDWLEDIEIIRREGYKLLYLIDSILDLVRIETGQLSLNPEILDPVHVIEGVVHSLTPLAHQNRNQLQVNYSRDLGLMYTDLSQMQKILHHLLENALKFTEKGHVQLDAFRHGDWIEFQIRDTGIGISTEQQHCLFEAFTQADDSLCRKYGGTGLGLTLCRHLCHQMGGEIKVKSQLGQGSTFRVRLKASVPDQVRHRAG